MQFAFSRLQILMSSLDDLLKKENILYLKQRLNECEIYTPGDLELIFSGEDISQLLRFEPREKVKIRVMIDNFKREEEKHKHCKKVSFCYNN